MYSYHIKDLYFTKAAEFLKTNETHLMSNKEDTNYRPHFLCFKDNNNPDILWAVPQSSKVEKYQRLIQSKMQKYGRCDTIVIGEFAGRNNAFLIQNMFPISERYIDHVHTISGKPVEIHPNLQAEIQSKARRVLNIYKRNKKILFADINKLYLMVSEELSAGNQNS